MQRLSLAVAVSKHSLLKEALSEVPQNFLAKLKEINGYVHTPRYLDSKSRFSIKSEEVPLQTTFPFSKI